MSDHLVKRLRDANYTNAITLCNEAANEIVWLWAEIERLREEVRGLTAALGVTWSIGEG